MAKKKFKKIVESTPRPTKDYSSSKKKIRGGIKPPKPPEPAKAPMPTKASAPKKPPAAKVSYFKQGKKKPKQNKQPSFNNNTESSINKKQKTRSFKRKTKPGSAKKVKAIKKEPKLKNIKQTKSNIIKRPAPSKIKPAKESTSFKPNIKKSNKSKTLSQAKSSKLGKFTKKEISRLNKINELVNGSNKDNDFRKNKNDFEKRLGFKLTDEDYSKMNDLMMIIANYHANSLRSVKYDEGVQEIIDRYSNGNKRRTSRGLLEAFQRAVNVIEAEVETALEQQRESKRKMQAATSFASQAAHEEAKALRNSIEVNK